MRMIRAALLVGALSSVLCLSARAGGEPQFGRAVFEHGIGIASGAPKAPPVLKRHLTAMQSACQPRPVYARWTYRNIFYVTLWRYTEQVYFCFTGSLVTYFYRYRWADLPSLLPGIGWNPWTFDGNINSNCAGEHCFIRDFRDTSRTAWTQGKFSVCGVRAAGVCNNQIANVYIKVYGDGTFDTETHGG